jgi:hypothetical protein
MYAASSEPHAPGRAKNARPSLAACVSGQSGGNPPPARCAFIPFSVIKSLQICGKNFVLL